MLKGPSSLVENIFASIENGSQVNCTSLLFATETDHPDAPIIAILRSLIAEAKSLEAFAENPAYPILWDKYKKQLPDEKSHEKIVLYFSLELHKNSPQFENSTVINNPELTTDPNYLKALQERIQVTHFFLQQVVSQKWKEEDKDLYIYILHFFWDNIQQMLILLSKSFANNDFPIGKNILFFNLQKRIAELIFHYSIPYYEILQNILESYPFRNKQTHPRKLSIIHNKSLLTLLRQDLWFSFQSLSGVGFEYSRLLMILGAPAPSKESFNDGTKLFKELKTKLDSILTIVNSKKNIKSKKETKKIINFMEENRQKIEKSYEAPSSNALLRETYETLLVLTQHLTTKLDVIAQNEIASNQNNTPLSQQDSFLAFMKKDLERLIKQKKGDIKTAAIHFNGLYKQFENMPTDISKKSVSELLEMLAEFIHEWRYIFAHNHPSPLEKMICEQLDIIFIACLQFPQKVTPSDQLQNLYKILDIFKISFNEQLDILLKSEILNLKAADFVKKNKNLLDLLIQKIPLPEEFLEEHVKDAKASFNLLHIRIRDVSQKCDRTEIGEFLVALAIFVRGWQDYFSKVKSPLLEKDGTPTVLKRLLLKQLIAINVTCMRFPQQLAAAKKVELPTIIQVPDEKLSSDTLLGDIYDTLEEFNFALATKIEKVLAYKDTLVQADLHAATRLKLLSKMFEIVSLLTSGSTDELQLQINSEDILSQRLRSALRHFCLLEDILSQTPVQNEKIFFAILISKIEQIISSWQHYFSIITPVLLKQKKLSNQIEVINRRLELAQIKCSETLEELPPASSLAARALENHLISMSKNSEPMITGDLIDGTDLKTSIHQNPAEKIDQPVVISKEEPKPAATTQTENSIEPEVDLKGKNKKTTRTTTLREKLSQFLKENPNVQAALLTPKETPSQPLEKETKTTPKPQPKQTVPVNTGRKKKRKKKSEQNQPKQQVKQLSALLVTKKRKDNRTLSTANAASPEKPQNQGQETIAPTANTTIAEKKQIEKENEILSSISSLFIEDKPEVLVATKKRNNNKIAPISTAATLEKQATQETIAPTANITNTEKNPIGKASEPHELSNSTSSLLSNQQPELQPIHLTSQQNGHQQNAPVAAALEQNGSHHHLKPATFFPEKNPLLDLPATPVVKQNGYPSDLQSIAPTPQQNGHTHHHPLPAARNTFSPPKEQPQNGQSSATGSSQQNGHLSSASSPALSLQQNSHHFRKTLHPVSLYLDVALEFLNITIPNSNQEILKWLFVYGYWAFEIGESVFYKLNHMPSSQEEIITNCPVEIATRILPPKTYQKDISNPNLLHMGKTKLFCSCSSMAAELKKRLTIFSYCVDYTNRVYFPKNTLEKLQCPFGQNILEDLETNPNKIEAIKAANIRTYKKIMGELFLQGQAQNTFSRLSNLKLLSLLVPIKDTDYPIFSSFWHEKLQEIDKATVTSFLQAQLKIDGIPAAYSLYHIMTLLLLPSFHRQIKLNPSFSRDAAATKTLNDFFAQYKNQYLTNSVEKTCFEKNTLPLLKVYYQQYCHSITPKLIHPQPMHVINGSQAILCNNDEMTPSSSHRNGFMPLYHFNTHLNRAKVASYNGTNEFNDRKEFNLKNKY